MLIHLMQHGACLSKELDVQQPLSPVGREMVTKTAKAAQILGLQFELMVASTKQRSRQTAEIMAQYTGYPVARIETTDAVKALAPPNETITFIQEYEGLDSIFIAGHLPSLAKVASEILLGNQSLDINIENAGLMQIEIHDQKKPKLNWYISPAQLAQIADS